MVTYRVLLIGGIGALAACSHTDRITTPATPSRTPHVVAAPIHDVRTVAELSMLYCPMVLQHAGTGQGLHDTSYAVADTATRIVLFDVSGVRTEILRLTVAGPPRGPVSVTIAYSPATAASDSIADACSKRIFGAIDQLVTRLHVGDSVVLASTPTTLGPNPTAFTVPGGIPAHGPRIELAVTLPPEVKLQATHGVGLYLPDGTQVRLEAVSIATDGTKRTLRFGGFESSRAGEAITFWDDVAVAPTARADRVLISANVPVQATRIDWWTGDPSQRIVWP